MCRFHLLPLDRYLGRKWHCISVMAFRGITISYWEKKPLLQRSRDLLSIEKIHKWWITAHKCLNTNFLPVFPARSWHILGSNRRGDGIRAKGQQAHSLGLKYEFKAANVQVSSSMFFFISFLSVALPVLLLWSYENKLLQLQFALLWNAVCDHCCEKNNLLVSCFWQNEVMARKQPAQIAGSKTFTCNRTAAADKMNDKSQAKVVSQFRVSMLTMHA